jgi:RNA polymerase sigma-B factor
MITGLAQEWPTAQEDPAALALAAVAGLDRDAPARRRVRDEVVCAHLPLARRLAGRFANCGEPLEDLVQVATLALINAAERYDISHGVSFAGFASPTILGELRHHFRDSTWHIRVNRRLQELRLEARDVADDLAQQLGRTATTEEVAERMKVGADQVRSGIASGQAYRVTSLNAPVAVNAGSAELGDLLGEDDRAIDSFADRHALAQLVAGLPEADQRLLSLRFSGNLTQTQIAGRLGISQMQVSRLLAAVLEKLRRALLSD